MHPLFRGATVIPVLSIERESDAVPLARALSEGGLRVLEVTFRTEAAAASIAAIAAALPQVVVGAGTLLRAADVGDREARRRTLPGEPRDAPGTRGRGIGERSARPAGRGDVVRGDGGPSARDLCHEALSGRGVWAVSGWLRAAAPGCFPASPSAPPAASTSASAEHYLALPNVPMVGGSWMAPRDAIAAGDWASHPPPRRTRRRDRA